MRTFRTVLTVATVLLAATACGETQQVGGGGGDGGGDDKNLTLGAVAFDESIASSYLWKELLEQQGYTVKVEILDVAPVYAGVATGQLDASLALSPLYQEDYWEQYKADFEELNIWYEGVSQAVAVPESLGITSMDELADHAAELNNEIVGIEAGSGLMGDLHEKAVDAYGLQDFKIIDGSTPAMLAAVDKAHSEDRPIAATMWQPHWALSAYPMVILEDPKGVFGGEGDLRSIGSKQFAEEQPEVVEQLGKFKMTPDDLQSLELAISEAGEGAEQEAAKGWIEENQSVVEAWTSAS
jgi:glycine betaine/proline transport system substrate-binding protein